MYVNHVVHQCFFNCLLDNKFSSKVDRKKIQHTGHTRNSCWLLSIVNVFNNKKTQTKHPVFRHMSLLTNVLEVGRMCFTWLTFKTKRKCCQLLFNSLHASKNGISVFLYF